MEQAERNKLRHTILKSPGENSASAFEPFVSKGGNEEKCKIFNQTESRSDFESHENERTFRPVTSSPHKQKSYTGQSFINLFSAKPFEKELAKEALGVIKQPKPNRQLIINIYEDEEIVREKDKINEKCLTVSSNNLHPSPQEKSFLSNKDVKRADARHKKDVFTMEKGNVLEKIAPKKQLPLSTNEPLLIASANYQSNEPVQPNQFYSLNYIRNFPCDMVKCEAWKSFVFVLSDTERGTEIRE